MRIAITGAGGLVSSALRRALPEATLFRHRELDVTDPDAVRRALAGFDVAINCAVIGVDAAEEQPELARRVNVDGAANVAAAVPIAVQFSSNYVLDVVNVYGRTKLDGERAALAANPRTVVIRTSWVFGEGGTNFLSTVHKRLCNGERVEAIEDIFASATYAPDLALRTVELLQTPGVRNVVNDGVLSYADFADQAAGIVGADPRLVVRVLSNNVMRAPRPRNTPLMATAPLRHWRDALRAYVLMDGLTAARVPL
ncbi:MAG TPA: NAD(P)-dependent oxidoreductase [Thermoanaerobaculia bacterium]|nr:NAD(P)-dependent oxidoreductase [Thermoanaerobaculia bacterium]